MAQGIIFGQIAAGGSSIKNIQHKTIVITGTSNTVSITSVVTANTAIIWGGFNSSDTSPGENDDTAGFLTLTNSTTVTATRVGSIGSLTFRFVVVEYEDGVLNSNTTGNIELIGGTGFTNTDTISSVDTSKTMMLYLGKSSSSGAEYDANNFNITVELTDATTVTATRIGAGGTFNAFYQAIEFN